MQHLLPFFRMILLILVIATNCCIPLNTYAQKKWDGEGMDSDWNNPSNWNGDVLPQPSDDVLLDNSFVVGDYGIIITSGTGGVTLHSLVIQPAAGNHITLSIPSTNGNSPALTVSSIFKIENGVLFRNASGAKSGASLVLLDSMYIANGGRYIHQTARSHSAVVAVLSQSPGTENGVFEFDVPDASSTISFSDRRYGMLILSAAAAGGSVNYTAAGTRPVLVRSDFIINPGVRLNLNSSDTLHVLRDFIQNGGTVNLGTLNRKLVLSIKGNIVQHSQGVLTKSGNVIPELLLSGNSLQQIDIAGIIEHEVSFVMNNLSGAELVSPLKLPYLLDLRKGVISTLDTANFITLLNGCGIKADSTKSDCFIACALRKEGLVSNDRFLFPVGGQGHQHWLELKEATGNFTVQYITGNPTSLNSSFDGIDHISRLEYWNVQGDNNANAKVELSFPDANFSGVTDIGTLRVAQLTNVGWRNAGSVATTGSAGADGSVVSDPVSVFNPSPYNFFTLASSVTSENPLPVRLNYFSVRPEDNGVVLEWLVNDVHGNGKVEGMMCEPGSDSFKIISSALLEEGRQRHHISLEPSLAGKLSFKLKIVEEGREVIWSNIVSCSFTHQATSLTAIKPSVTRGSAHVLITASKPGTMQLYVIDMQGRMVKTMPVYLSAGVNNFTINFSDLHSGFYHIFGLSSTIRTTLLRFFKL